jgi:hypothetical protein
MGTGGLGGVGTVWGVAVVAGLSVGLFTGCGGDGGAGGRGGNGGGAPLRQPAWIVDGGEAAKGTASGGGAIHVVSQGVMTLGASMIAAPAVPAPSAGTMAVGGAQLGADVTASGSIQIGGQQTVTGSDLVRQITSSGGDIFVSGELHAGDTGIAGRGLTLRAPNGTIYVSGTIDCDGVAAGESGGALILAAGRVVVMGSLSAAGADGPSGGNGAAVTITGTDLVYLGGPVQLRGGGGMTSGGAGGTLAVDTSGALQAVALVDARGGAATGDNAMAGAAGAIHIGEQTAPATVDVSVPMSARGGGGGVTGGPGGSIVLEPKMGNLIMAGTIDFTGGAGGQPGGGGTLTATVGEGVGTSQADGGDIDLAGKITGDGGAATSGGNGNGADAGTLTLTAASYLGTLTVDMNGSVSLTGGASAGSGTSGGGGHLNFLTSNGDLTVRGHLTAKGGDAADSGGIGGLGGAVDIFSDNNHDGYGGNLLLDTTCVVDASGGSGAIGGDARHDDTPSVASFPDNQEKIAVLINCDGKHGNTANWLRNDGMIIARGGAPNGNGGDVAYHGIAPDGNVSPPSGNIDTSGSGSGAAGNFRGE